MNELKFITGVTTTHPYTKNGEVFENKRLRKGFCIFTLNLMMCKNKYSPTIELRNQRKEISKWLVQQNYIKASWKELFGYKNLGSEENLIAVLDNLKKEDSATDVDMVIDVWWDDFRLSKEEYDTSKVINFVCEELSIKKKIPQKIKIDCSKKRSKEEWLSIFKRWSDYMDVLYPNSNRNSAEMWDENPAEWMEKFNTNVYEAWCEYDVDSPMYDFDKKLKDLVI